MVQGSLFSLRLQARSILWLPLLCKVVLLLAVGPLTKAHKYVSIVFN